MKTPLLREFVRSILRETVLGEGYEDVGTAATAMPPTMHPSTIPAAKSKAEQEANAELAGKLTRNPKTHPMSDKNIKLNLVRKELDKMGYASDKPKAKRVTHELPTWLDSLDPNDALVSTAAELAQRFATGS